ncbi:aminoglycoside phosphotransferase family protein [Caballeronia sp. J97]|uniref:phosphotransferase family protein n=1 Tax=Caballeronia sp. J97 TaxID=2805429 RepID=UPI002AAFF9A3|nr:aminoglycoside phosphotransferase family protein [Caballeronia sp. J97]
MISQPFEVFEEPLLDEFLRSQGLLGQGETGRYEPLTGGVSSDIWKIDLVSGSVCVKRARPTLKVVADWQAPLSRNSFEWAWLKFAASHCPANVPQALAHDREKGLILMEFLAPEHHPVWKHQLLHDHVSVETARNVGDLVGRLHAASAGDQSLAKEFDADENFYSLRLEPYLVAAATVNPSVARELLEIVDRTRDIHLAVVHGDVSPKNILVGPNGPVLLDAECANYGDPAFDLAFCLNHLLLKQVIRPADRGALAASFSELYRSYLLHVHWESVTSFESRAAALLPGLLLARVDGKSPVEYLTENAQQELVRSAALSLLRKPTTRLAQILENFLLLFEGQTGV